MATFIVISREGSTQAPDKPLKNGSTYEGRNYVPGKWVNKAQVLGYARYGDGPAFHVGREKGLSFDEIVKLAFEAWRDTDEDASYMQYCGFDEVCLQELHYDSYDDVQRFFYLQPTKEGVQP